MHRNEVDVFNKQKEHKTCEFGRQFQIGRIVGNIVWSVPNSSIRMLDAQALKPMVRGHINTFQRSIIYACADKGYYSKDNEKFLLDLKVPKVAKSPYSIKKSRSHRETVHRLKFIPSHLQSIHNFCG